MYKADIASGFRVMSTAQRSFVFWMINQTGRERETKKGATSWEASAGVSSRPLLRWPEGLRFTFCPSQWAEAIMKSRFPAQSILLCPTASSLSLPPSLARPPLRPLPLPLSALHVSVCVCVCVCVAPIRACVKVTSTMFSTE